MPKKFQKISEEVIHQNPHWAYKCDNILVDDKESKYFYVDIIGNTVIVPVLDDGRIVLVRQYRYLRDRYSVEFPGGKIEADETPAQSAIRELKEETGFESSNFSKLGEFEPDSGVCRDLCHVFLANEIGGAGAQQLDDNEDMEILLRRPEEINEMIKRGEIWQGHALAAWSLVRDFIDKRS